MPPWSINWTEPIYLPERNERRKIIAEAGYNTFGLQWKNIGLDQLTDSGTAALSDYQWDGLIRGDERYVRGENEEWFRYEVVPSILGYPYTQITHQGRSAEHLVAQNIIKSGQYLPKNIYFTTTRAHIEGAGAVSGWILLLRKHMTPKVNIRSKETLI